MLWLANLNPAFKPLKELFDDDLAGPLHRLCPAHRRAARLLRNPARASRTRTWWTCCARRRWLRRTRWKDSSPSFASTGPACWATCCGDCWSPWTCSRKRRLAIWMRFHPPERHGGMGPTFGDSSAAAIPQFRDREFEYERFSQDVEWMPRTVMIAKSIYVWLRPALDRLPPPGPHARPDSRRGAGHAGPPRLQRPVADRRLGAQPRLAADQAADRQPGSRRLGLLAARLRHRRRSRRRSRLHQPARPRLPRAAFAWPATWFPTTWASIRAG